MDRLRQDIERLLLLPGNAVGTNGYDNVIPTGQQGNSRDYTIRRLKRDQPELAAEMGASGKVVDLNVERARLKDHGGDRKSEGYREQQNQVDGINLIHNGGTGSAYRVARLRRDAPEVAERLEDGGDG